MNIPCFDLFKEPPKRLLAYTLAPLLLIGSLPVSAERPYADFTVEPIYGSVPFEVNVDASGSDDKDGSIKEYKWSAEDGQIKAQGQEKTTITFEKMGRHDITLIVFDDAGDSDEARQTVEAIETSSDSETFPPINPKITVTPEEGKAPLIVTLDASESTGNIIAYNWSISDGENEQSAFGQKVSWLFQEAGDYTITLTVEDSYGESATPLEYPNPIVITQASEPQPDPENKLPEAKFTAAVDADTVQLDGSDSIGTITEYEWQVLENGQEAKGESASFTFGKAGKYTIQLTVTDDKGTTDSTEQTVTIEESPPTSQPPTSSLGYNSTARRFPQVIAAGVTPSILDMTDDQFDIVALVRPGASPIRTVSFQSTDGVLKNGMTQAGVLDNGDEIYKMTFVFPRGTMPTKYSTAWGSREGQFNIVAKSELQEESHTYPYLKIGHFPTTDNSSARKEVAPISYDTKARSRPQVIMAGYSPTILDKSDDQFDVIAIVRAGILSIRQVVLKQNEGPFDLAMESVGELDNGDKVYKFTYTFERGGLGNPDDQPDGIIDYKDLWGPNALQFGIEVVDTTGARSHKFPDIESGNNREFLR